MQFTKLSKINHYEEITNQLHAMIRDGTLKVGDKLPSTKEMAEQFGVGRSTMREALSALKAMGLIEIRQGGGCRVIAAHHDRIELPEADSLRMNKVLFQELLEVRLALEVSIAALAAEKRTDEDVKGLDNIIQEMERSLGNDLEGERLDLLFHQSLAAMTHNSLMVQLFDSMMNYVETAIQHIRRVELYANQAVADELFRQHIRIFQAVKAGDAAEASNSTKLHLKDVGAILSKYLDSK